MTIFGVLWILLIVFCLCKQDIKYMLSLTLFSMVLQCSNVIQMGSLSVGPQVITNIAFIIMMLLITLKHHTIKIRRLRLVSLSLFLLVFIVIISSYMNGILSSSGMKILQIIIYAISFCIIQRLSEKVDKEYQYNMIRKITVFILVMGVIQILITANIIPRISLIKVLFYNEDAYNVYFNHNNYYRLMSTFMEPSYCGCFLVGSFFYFLSTWRGSKRDSWLLIWLAFEILLTQSSTAYGALAIVGLLFLLQSDNKKVKKVVIPLCILVLVFMLTIGYEILDAVILSKASSGSANTRYYWNQAAIEAFNSSKILGTGFKSTRASSIIYSLLGELGILGFGAYLLLNISICISVINIKRYTPQYIAACYALLAVVVGQIIACPDLEFCVYWLFLDFVGLCSLKKETGNEIKRNYSSL